MVTNTPLQKIGDYAGEELNLPSGFSLLFAFVVLYVYIICDIFLCKFGMTVLFVMYELLDISIACVLGGLL